MAVVRATVSGRRAAGRRALLHLGAAGTLATAALAIAAPAFARDAKKKADEEISPPEDLMREHAVLDRVMLIYENGLRRANQGEDIDPAVFVQSATIVRDFIHDYHEKSEEDLIFPQFKKAGRMIELVNVLLVQHGAGRKLTERILAAAPQARTREPREKMGRDIQAFITMYRPHEARESTDLFPTLRQLVTSDELEEIGDEMEKRERQKFGADGFETMAKKVAEVEKVIGLYDIDVFTPKS
ncbi:MAG: hemerythrin domain-containing protein [Alphaproteobacteria bacterium]|nr:hemerythrin domain-containing protein [Alphaproteobacteria bacterium]MBV8409717.1 hemerythrin domain-containing protein [Alphaproteobacteria bacterium]